MMLAVFVVLVCALAALVYFISVRRGVPPEQIEQQRDKAVFLRDEPPPHN
jgi:hypothetical protein